jgi:general secretion pathway protein K
MKKNLKTLNRSKEGAALLVALAVLIILSLIVGSFAFEVQLEAMLVSHKRKRFHAEMMARSGIEYAWAILDMRGQAKELEIEDMAEDEGGFMKAALHIKRSLSTTSTIELGEGSFSVTLESAEGRLNVNMLSREDWLDILEMANVPSTDWDTMIDCLKDWIDEGDLHKLNGAESDDPFYQDAGYPVKNGSLDSVQELLLIKGWGPDILYGKEDDDEGDEIFGIAELLTVWGGGKLNINTASIDAMRAAGLSDEKILEILEAKNDDFDDPKGLGAGLKSLSQVGVNSNNFTLQSEFVKVTSVGDVFGKQYQIDCIFLVEGSKAIIVYWEEGQVKKDANAR